LAESKSQLSRFTAIFAGGTLFSRVFGLVRDVIIAAYVPTLAKDAFTAAFKFPNMLRELVGEGATNAAFIPILSEYQETATEEEFRELVRSTLTLMVFVLTGLTALGIFLLRYLPGALALLDPFTQTGGLDAATKAYYTDVAMWTFPYLLFIGLAAFAMGPLFTVGHYMTPSWSPVLLNFALILSLLAPLPVPGEAYALVVGVWVGGVAQLAVNFWAMRRRVGVWLPNFRPVHPGVKRILLLMGPVIAGQAAGEVNKVVDTLFAMQLQAGTVFGLYLANRLVQLPHSMFGLGVAAAILPALSRSASRNEPDEWRETLTGGLRRSFFLIAPSMVGLIVLREPIVRLLFERNAFTADDVTLTATALAIYAAGLLSFAWVRVTVTGFYSHKHTLTPVVIASVSMVLNILLNFALVGPLGYRGLAWATTISYTANFLLVFAFLNARHGRLITPKLLDGLGRMLVATLCMGVAAYAVSVRLSVWLDGDVFWGQFGVVTGSVLAAMGVYFGLCKAMGVDELDAFVASVKRKGGRS